MTKDDILTRVGKRLGDTSSDFLSEVLDPIFDDVMAELALKECIRSLHRVATFTFDEGVTDYSTSDKITGSANVYPRHVLDLKVPGWGYPGGILNRKRDEDWDIIRMSRGVTLSGTPEMWRLYPNERQFQIWPAPEADDCTDDVEALYIAPPTVLTSASELTELHAEHVPGIVAGMVWYGLPFQDETLVDRQSAFAQWEMFIGELRRDAKRENGRPVRIKYRRNA